MSSSVSASEPNILSSASNSNGDPQDSEIASTEIIACILLKQSKLSAAFYIVDNQEIRTFDSLTDSAPSYKFLHSVLFQMEPSVIIISSNVTKDFGEIVDLFCQSRPVSISKFSAKQFNYAVCKSRVLSIELSGVLADLDIQAKQHYILSAINISDEGLVSATGGLLLYLTTEYPKTHSLQPDVPIVNIGRVKIETCMWIDEETYKNLQIFDSIEHPSSFKWVKDNQNTKEGFSLYHLLGKYCSKLGLPYLRMFMANPTNDIDILKSRHQVIEFVNSLSNQKTLQILRTYIGQLSTFSVLMHKLACQKLRGSHWKFIYKNIYYSVLIAETCKANQGIRIFKEIADTFDNELYAMANQINNVIDLEGMERNQPFVIKYGVCENLDIAKARFSNLRSIINKITPFEFDSVPDYISSLNILYIPEFKFVLSIPFWRPNLNESDLKLPNLDYKFTANQVAYYKSQRCYQLDEILGDPQIHIMEEESKIIQELVRYLANNVHHLIELMQKIIQLDCILAIAKLSKENKYRKPELTNDRRMEIVNGRHPLLEHCSNESFICNDFCSDLNSSLIKIIFGPNVSGKTIYMKQVALIVYMAHIGCYVPAESAVIGTLQNIYSRITNSTTETVSSKTSSYLVDLKFLSAAICESSSRSLITIDEVGRSTSEENAVPLISGFINYLLNSPECPHLLLATQYFAVYDFLEKSKLISVLSMDFMINNKTVVYLYKIKPGLPTHCCLLNIAHSYNVPDQVINVAEKVLITLRTGDNLQPYSSARLRRRQRFLNFVKRFTFINMSKPGYMDKLTHKIQRVFQGK